MNTQALISLLSAIINVILALFVIIRNKKSYLNITFVLMTICIAFWNINTFGLFIATSEDFAVKWSSIFRHSLFLLPAVTLHFLTILTNTNDKRRKKIIISAYIYCFIISIIALSGYFRGNIVRKKWGYFPSPDLPYKSFIVGFTVFFGYGLFLLFKKYKTVRSAIEKNKLKYALAALIVGIVVGSTNFFPSFFDAYPLGNFAGAVYTGIIAYSIAKHRLLEIEVILKRGAIYTGLAGFITACYMLVIFTSVQLFGTFTSTASIIMIALSSFIIAMTLEPLRNKLDMITDKIFFRGKYDYQKTLKDLSKAMSSMIKLDDVINTVINTIVNAMRVENALYLLIEEDTDEFNINKAIGYPEEKMSKISLEKSHPLVSWLEKKKEILVTEELEKEKLDELTLKKIREKLKDLNASVCVPVIEREAISSIIVLGNKMSQDIFNKGDLELLSTISYQMSIAIENSKLFEEMQRNERLALVGSMAASLAHEIKNPLTAIKAFIQMVPDKYKEASFRKKFDEIVPNEVERLVNLSEDLLKLSKPSKPNFENINVNDILERVGLILENQLKKRNIKLVKKLSSIPFILADEHQLMQVFLNIGLNAISAIGKNGILEIASNSDHGRYVEIQFVDNGVGILDKDIKRIFEPFFSTRKEGTGLGLATCQRTIEAHGGLIKVKSKTGQGSTFTIQLPLRSKEE